MRGTTERPRLSVFRSVSHIYVQVIDDMAGHDGGVGVEHRARGQGARWTGDTRGGNRKGAELVGTTIAERLKEKGITRVIFDRNGFLYHGRVRAVAEAARAAGLEF